VQTRHLMLIGGAVGALLLVGIVFALFQGPIGSTLGSPTLARLSTLSADNVDRLIIRKSEDEVTLRKLEVRWMIEDRGAFAAKLDALWELVSELDAVPTIARNPVNHSRLGVTESEAMSVTFWSNDETVGELLIGNWSGDSQSTFVRRAGTDAVAMVPGDLAGFLAPRFDDWRDPTIVNAGNVLVRSMTFSYPDEEFEVKLVLRSSGAEIETTGQLLAQAAAEQAIVTGGVSPSFGGAPPQTPTPDPVRPAWVIQTATGEIDAAPDRIIFLLRLLTPLLSEGFADELWEVLGQKEPAWTLEVGGTGIGSLAFLQFYPKDETTFYVRKAGSREVFLIDESRAIFFRSRARDLAALTGTQGGLGGIF
jgi:hypothetical protein